MSLNQCRGSRSGEAGCCGRFRESLKLFLPPSLEHTLDRQWSYLYTYDNDSFFHGELFKNDLFKLGTSMKRRGKPQRLGGGPPLNWYGFSQLFSVVRASKLSKDDNSIA